MVYHSKNAYALIGQESTWGTPVTADRDIGIIQNITATSRNNIIKAFGLSDRNVAKLVTGKFDVGLDGEIQFQHGRLLEYTLGSVGHVETTGDWKHTFTEADETPSFTLEDGFNGTTDVVLTYAGCKIANTTIALAVDGILTQRFTGIAKTVATGTSASSGVVSALPVFHSLTGELKLETVALGKVQSFDVTINNNTEIVFELGNRFGAEAISKNREYDFTFSMAFESLDEYNEFLGQANSPITTEVTPVTIEFKASNGTALGSGNREFFIKFTDAKIEEVGVPVRVGENVFADFRGMAKSLDDCYSVDNIADTSW